MPFKSRAQMKYLYAKHPKIAKEFAEHTKSIKKLPEHVKRGGKIKNKSKRGWKRLYEFIFIARLDLPYLFFNNLTAYLILPLLIKH